MKQWVNSVIREIALIRWLIPAVFMHELGRWYVFRNTPTWVLEEIECYPDDESIKNIYSDAIQELSLRRKNEL